MLSEAHELAPSPVWLGPYEYRLPAELIAQRPCRRRDGSRLMVVERSSGAIRHRGFAELGDVLSAGDLLVANDSRVVRARLVGRKHTGGRVELLLTARADATSVEAIAKASKPLRAGQAIELGPEIVVEVVRVDASGRVLLDFGAHDVDAVMERHGGIPLPPYIRGGVADATDGERYQTVYSCTPGSIAAPTAGLHFTEDLIDNLAQRGIGFARLTLHVGPGTFVPMHEDPSRHRMEGERFEVPAETTRQIAGVRSRGGRVVAVGTTSVRALESSADPSSSGSVVPTDGATDLFIRPGYRFNVVDSLLTNFHLPRSTLLALVMAFAGEALLRRAYEVAIEQRYRFYSYGDAMLIL